MSAAIQDGKYVHTSASQLSLFRTCPRRWYYSYVKGIKEQETESLRAGTALHKQLEDWYEKGKTPASPSARLLLTDPRLPARGKNVLIEHPRDYETGLFIGDTLVKGRIDLLHAPSDSHVNVIDWKSSSNLKYAKTAEALKSDWQLGIYSVFVFTRFPSVETVSLFHGTLSSANLDGKLSEEECPPEAKVSMTEPLTKDSFDATYETITATVEQIQDVVATAAGPDDVLARYSADRWKNASCWSFGKVCPAAAQCSAFQANTKQYSPAEEEAAQPEGEKHMSLKEKIAARSKNSTPVPVMGTPSATAPVSINPPDANYYSMSELFEGRFSRIEKRLDALEAVGVSTEEVTNG